MNTVIFPLSTSLTKSLTFIDLYELRICCTTMVENIEEEGEIGEMSSRFACVMTGSDNKGAGSTWGLLPYVSQKALEQKGHWFI